MVSGFATDSGTARFAERFSTHDPSFFREAQGLRVSSLGIGTYLGTMNDATDESYRQSVLAALRGGINCIDTSLNYRNQRSERAIGRALEDWPARDEIVVSTKAGYLVPDAIPFDRLRREDIVADMHSLAPAFLVDQIERSRVNLGLETIDIFYLHNPETQLGHATDDEFYARMQTAFETAERMVSDRRIRFYGTATWDGYRRPGALSLRRLEAAARAVGGNGHHFRFIQLPVNLAMPEAVSKPVDNNRTVLDIAVELGITAVGSASLLQARLTRGLPDELAQALSPLSTDALRAIQFTRSAPGITVALTGMSQPGHVEENLRIAESPALSPEQFRQIFQ